LLPKPQNPRELIIKWKCLSNSRTRKPLVRTEYLSIKYFKTM